MKECSELNCAMCKFAKDKGETLLSRFMVMGYAKQETNDAQSELDLSNMSEHWINAMSDRDNIPIGYIAAWSKLQSEDDSIKKAIAYRKSGQNPPK